MSQIEHSSKLQIQVIDLIIIIQKTKLLFKNFNSFFKKYFLPLVELAGMEIALIAQLRDCFLFQ